MQQRRNLGLREIFPSSQRRGMRSRTPLAKLNFQYAGVVDSKIGGCFIANFWKAQRTQDDRFSALLAGCYFF